MLIRKLNVKCFVKVALNFVLTNVRWYIYDNV